MLGCIWLDGVLRASHGARRTLFAPGLVLGRVLSQRGPCRTPGSLSHPAPEQAGALLARADGPGDSLPRRRRCQRCMHACARGSSCWGRRLPSTRGPRRARLAQARTTDYLSAAVLGSRIGSLTNAGGVICDMRYAICTHVPCASGLSHARGSATRSNRARGHFCVVWVSMACAVPGVVRF